jgi:hypothetical protein
MKAHLTLASLGAFCLLAGGAASANPPAERSEASRASGSGGARCAVQMGGRSWSGPCVVRRRGGGSFAVRRPGGQMILGSTNIAVTMASGRAEVEVSVDGSNLMLGYARRSQRDAACWIVAEDSYHPGHRFSVCTY